MWFLYNQRILYYTSMTWKNWFCFVLFCFVFLQNFNSLSGIISILQGIRFIKQNGLSSSFSSQSPKPHLLADSCNIPITAFPVFMFSSWSRKYDRFCIFPNISPQMLVNPLAFKGPQNLSFCWQQEYRLFFSFLCRCYLLTLLFIQDDCNLSYNIKQTNLCFPNMN